MLSPPKRGSSYVPDEDEKGDLKLRGVGIDRSTLNRWKTYIKPWMINLVKIWEIVAAGQILDELGYKKTKSHNL